jgi:WS/DGAT/MGAT family acyltransferase
MNDVVVEGLADLVSDVAGAVRGAAGAIRQPQSVADEATAWGDTLSSLAAQAPAMPWNGPLSRRRVYRRCRVPLDGIKQVRAATGATVNDVVLAACSDALGRYLVHLGQVVAPDLVLRAVVPASVRADHEHEELGNRVAVMMTDLPVGESDGIRRLERVAEAMARAKESGQAEATDQLLQLARFGPGGLMGPVSRLALRYRVSNVTITNVPGPDIPLYCMGAQLRDVSPYVGLLDNNALTIGVISYRDHLGFGLVGDPDLTPDLTVLSEGIVDAAAEMVTQLA